MGPRGRFFHESLDGQYASAAKFQDGPGSVSQPREDLALDEAILPISTGSQILGHWGSQPLGLLGKGTRVKRQTSVHRLLPLWLDLLLDCRTPSMAKVVKPNCGAHAQDSGSDEATSNAKGYISDCESDGQVE
jgi:hypothetical protein